MTVLAEFSGNWLRYVSPGRRRALLEILTEISKRVQKHHFPVIVIGACSLLIRGCLQYKAWWDVDLLFETEEDLFRFHQLPKHKIMQVFPMDETLQHYEHLSSLQTMWGADHKWYRVDYIFRGDYYHFHSHTPNSSLFYQDEITWNNVDYPIRLQVAHPWNIFVEKLLSERLNLELEQQNLYSIDIRHLFKLYSLYCRQTDFWSYISDKLAGTEDKAGFKENLKKLLQKKNVLGYTGLQTTSEDFQLVEAI